MTHPVANLNLNSPVTQRRSENIENPSTPFRDLAPIFKLAIGALENSVTRTSHLAHLKEKLATKPNTHTQLCVLYGPGGIGKTELACHFGSKAFNDYSLVFWLNSETEETLRSSYTSLAKALKIYLEKEDGLNTIRSHVHTCLEQRKKPWLLIYDNVEKTIPLPQHGGSVLITTQTGELWKEHSHHVSPFSLEEALQLLQKASPASCEKELRELAQKLDCFPLALGQAAAYLKEEGILVPEYLAKLQHILEEEGTERHPKSLVMTLAMTWGITLQKLKQHHRAALAWLKCCAYLGPTAIPEKVLIKWLSAQPNSNNVNSNNAQNPKDVLMVLKRYNLISWDMAAGCLSLHRQMQEMLRHENKDSIESDLIEVMKALESSFNEENTPPEEFKHDFSLLPHFEAVLIHTQAIKELSLPAKEALAETLFNTGNLHRGMGSYQQAETLLQQSLKLSEAVWGEESSQVARALNNLGVVYDDQGQHGKAIQLYEQALEIKEKTLGKDHLDVATSLNNLGVSYKAQKQDDKAIRFYEQALEIRKKALGENHPVVATTLSNLAGVYYDKGQHDKAAPLYEQALEIRKKTLGEKHPAVAASLSSLATVYDDKGQHDKAAPLYEQALEIRKEALGEKHPDVATTLSNLARVYYSKGQYGKAIKFYKQVLEIRKKAPGDNNPQVIKKKSDSCMLQ